MNKPSQSKVKYCIQSEKHSMQTTFGLCSLMEHQSLVDIAICCGSNILHAHKVVLAANSPLFREEFEQNPTIEQVIISGCEFTVIRALIEFIYCGETFINEDLIKYLVAAAKLFQMKSLEHLSTDYQFSDDFIALPKPQFLTKKPKYPAFPFKSSGSPSINPLLKPLNYNVNQTYKPQKVKRKFRMEAEHQACLKEALASRLAIANLKKEIGSAPQSSTFIIEDTCTETTVENFIPTTDNTGFVELDLNGQIVIPENHQQQFGTASEPVGVASKSNIIQLTLPNGEQDLTAEKIKKILGNQANSNVEIMFRTNDGTFVTVTDEVLQNLQKEGLQYQVIDEEGRMGEVQELRLLNKDLVEKVEKIHESDTPVVEFFSDTKITKNVEAVTDEEISNEIKPIGQDFEVSSFLQNPKSEAEQEISISENVLKETTNFSPDMFFAEEESGENVSELLGGGGKKKGCSGRKNFISIP